MVVIDKENKKKKKQQQQQQQNKEEEEESERKEDFVKAVDDLLELVTKKFSRISRDMLGKSTFFSLFYIPPL